MAQEAAIGVCGTWASEDGDAHIRIERCADSVCGAIAWLKAPADPDGSFKRDDNNADPALRGRTLLGLPLLWGFRAQRDGSWIDGRIYNPQDGNTYRSYLDLAAPRRLKVSGCWFVFCGSETWTRIDAGAAC